MFRFSLQHPKSLTLGICTALLGLSLWSPAGAQVPTPCFITGNTSACKPIQLCGPGPSDLYTYLWTRPNGVTETGPCVMAEESGIYTLVVTSRATGIPSVPCTHEFRRTDGGIPCEITGDRVICRGETTELCGPPGAASYDWDGPGGFDSSDRCITVGTPGVYVLRVEDGAGCETVCRAEVRPCDGPGGFVCPRTPGFWTQQCTDRDNGSRKFSLRQMAAITDCIDDASDLFDWRLDYESFCAVIDPPKPMDLRKQVRRHYAALLANVCAGELGLETRNGEIVALDPSTVVRCGGERTTIGELIEDLDRLLVRLQGADLSNHAVRKIYGEILECLDAINNGRGLRLRCEDEKDPVLGPAQTESGAELGGVALYRAYPNPFRTSTRMAFAVSTGGEAVRIGVYDVTGRMVRSLANGFLTGGRHEVSWDGADAEGARVKPGIYFIRGSIGARPVGTQVLFMN